MIFFPSVTKKKAGMRGDLTGGEEVKNGENRAGREKCWSENNIVE